MSIGLGEQRVVGSRLQERPGLLEGYQSLGLVPNGNGGKGGKRDGRHSISRAFRAGRGWGSFAPVRLGG
jgi:hypothetical protein